MIIGTLPSDIPCVGKQYIIREAILKKNHKTVTSLYHRRFIQPNFFICFLLLFSAFVKKSIGMKTSRPASLPLQNFFRKIDVFLKGDFPKCSSGDLTCNSAQKHPPLNPPFAFFYVLFICSSRSQYVKISHPLSL